MTLTAKKQKQSRVIIAAILACGFAGCAQVSSGSWYDSEKDRPKAERSQKKAPPETDGKTGQNDASAVSRFGNVFSNLREKLDRRPEAQKQRDEARRARLYGSDNKTEVKTTKRASAKKVSLTAKGLVTVQKGETYYSLARRYNVPVRALLTANKARPPYVLAPGDRISIPRQEFYAVKKKDTLYSISRAHDTDVASLAKLNGLKKPFTISVGQRLQIPGKAGRIAATENAAPKKKVVKTARKTLPQAPKRVGRFRVPVQGSVISNYGPKEGGLHNDGINIAARNGAPILAAENGVVVYTGNELRGYGNLLLIRHSGGWVTAYAHISKFRVKPGAKVKQGEVIAEVGQTGNVDRPQLHFELRKGTRAVNPQSLI